jgi:hypothetical protein
MEEEDHQCPLYAYEKDENAHHLHIAEQCLQEEVQHDPYHIDMTGWEDDEVEHDGVQDVPPRVDAHTDVLEKPTKKPFIESYMKRIQPARYTIRGKWNECQWDKKYINIEAPATSNEVDALHF